MTKLVIIGDTDDPQAMGVCHVAKSLSIEVELLDPNQYLHNWCTEVTNREVAIYINGKRFGVIPNDSLYAYFRVPANVTNYIAREMDVFRLLVEAYSKPLDTLIPKGSEGIIWSKAVQHFLLGPFGSRANVQNRNYESSRHVVAKALNATTKSMPVHIASMRGKFSHGIVMTQELHLGAHMKTHAYRSRSEKWSFLTIMLSPLIGAIVDDSIDATAIAELIFSKTNSRFFDWDYISTECGAKVIEVNSSPAPLAFHEATPECWDYVQQMIMDWVV